MRRDQLKRLQAATRLVEERETRELAALTAQARQTALELARLRDTGPPSDPGDWARAGLDAAWQRWRHARLRALTGQQAMLRVEIERQRKRLAVAVARGRVVEKLGDKRR